MHKRKNAGTKPAFGAHFHGEMSLSSYLFVDKNGYFFAEPCAYRLYALSQKHAAGCIALFRMVWVTNSMLFLPFCSYSFWSENVFK